MGKIFHEIPWKTFLSIPQISWKFIYDFLNHPANKQTDKQANGSENSTPAESGRSNWLSVVVVVAAAAVAIGDERLSMVYFWCVYATFDISA